MGTTWIFCRSGLLSLLMVIAALTPHARAAVPLPEPAVEAGFYVSYALTRDGRLYAWGANFHGLLANGAVTTNEPYGTSVPRLVPLPPGATAWSAIQAGSSHALALDNNGNLYSWGTSHVGELGTGHALVTTSDVQVPKPAGVTRWLAIAAGQEHSVALADNRQLYAWGDNFYGELGNGNHINQPAPTPVLLPQGVTHWTDLWAGGAVTFARANDGKVYGWGRNQHGELGIGAVHDQSPFGVSSPVPILLPAGVSNWRYISAGRYHTLALDEQGQLYGWGSNEQNGLGYRIAGVQSTPAPLAHPTGVSSWRTLSAGDAFNVALSADGRLFGWGFGSGISSHTPAPIPSGRTNWNAIAAGVNHSLAIASDCGPYAWGWSLYGSLGNDDPPGRAYSIPDLVRRLPTLCDIVVRDADADGVPDDRDQCPDTPAGAIVNTHGCTIAQLCPCDGPWRNHGEYVQCVIDRAWQFFRDGLIDEDARKAIIRDAARSHCGNRQTTLSPCTHLCPQTRAECERDGLRLVFSGDPNCQHLLETSTDLINWSPVQPGAPIGEEILFPVNHDAKARFYRLRTP